jgi:hypothetical protein
MRIALRNCEETLISEIADKAMTRHSVAITYALAIQSGDNRNLINWHRVNTAIIERWSRSGLEYIKRRAWRLVR